MQIFIAGGFGYIGGRLALALSANGHEITLGTRQCRSSPDWLVNSKTVIMDWDNKAELSKICEGQDVVIQAAGMNAKDCAQDPVGAIKFNGEATKNLLDGAIQAAVSRFIYLSTAHVYKDPLSGKISETTPTENHHPYATSHLLGEQYVLEMNKSQHIDSVVVRITNGFGAPATVSTNCWSLLACDLCKQVIETGLIQLKSEITAQRDFIPLTDVCSAIIRIAEFKERPYCSQPINLASCISMSLIEFATLIQHRSEKLLLFSPKIITLHAKPKAKHNEVLQFSTNNLAKFSITLKLELDQEIDELLRFCKERFKSFV